jgi:hypothetical protein
MSSATPSRCRWLLLSFLLFTGIFAGSIASRVNQGAHIPVRLACRAIGASASLSSATRNLASEHRETPVSFVSTLFFIYLLTLAVPRLATTFAWLRGKASRRILSIISVPPLLFRPPPAFIVA